MNYVKYVIIIVGLTMFLSCSNSEGSNTPKEFVPTKPVETIGKNVDIESKLAEKVRILPSACSIINRKRIADVLGLEMTETGGDFFTKSIICLSSDSVLVTI